MKFNSFVCEIFTILSIVKEDNEDCMPSLIAKGMNTTNPSCIGTMDFNTIIIHERRWTSVINFILLLSIPCPSSLTISFFLFAGKLSRENHRITQSIIFQLYSQFSYLIRKNVKVRSSVHTYRLFEWVMHPYSWYSEILCALNIKVNSICNWYALISPFRKTNTTYKYRLDTLIFICRIYLWWDYSNLEWKWRNINEIMKWFFYF